MKPTREQCEALANELAEWIGRNQLWTDTVMRLIDEYDGEVHDGGNFRRYLMVSSAGNLSDVLCGYEFADQGRTAELRAEFLTILEKRGFWSEPYSNMRVDIYHK